MHNAYALASAQAHWGYFADDPPEDPVHVTLQDEIAELRELLNSALDLCQEAGAQLERMGTAEGTRVLRAMSEIEDALACVTQ